MKNYLYIFLRNARAAWILLTLEIFVTAVTYASARVKGLSDPGSIALACCIGTLLVIIDVAIVRGLNRAVLKSTPSRLAKSEEHTSSQQKLSDQEYIDVDK